MVDVHGTCDTRFEPVRGALAEQLESGNETGASIAVDVDGRTVVDIWGGWCDPGHGRGRLGPDRAHHAAAPAPVRPGQPGP